MSFKDWWTNENNPSLPKNEYMFGTRHIIMICIAVLSVIILSIIFHNKSQKTKNIVMGILVSVLLFFEIVSRIVNLIIAKDSVFVILTPMHICSVAVWVVIISYFFKIKTLINFATIVALLSTIAFLISPAVGINRTFISFTCLYSITSHVTGFVVSILFMTLGYANFKFKDIWKTYLCFAIMFLWGVLIDFVILPGEDYMYLRNDPLELNLNFPYQILYMTIIAVYILLFYLITFIKNKITSRNKEKIE